MAEACSEIRVSALHGEEGEVILIIIFCRMNVWDKGRKNLPRFEILQVLFLEANRSLQNF